MNKLSEKREEPKEGRRALVEVRKVFAAPLALFCFFFVLYISHGIYQGIEKGAMRILLSRSGSSEPYIWDTEPISYLFALGSNIVMGFIFIVATIALIKRLLQKNPAH